MEKVNDKCHCGRKWGEHDYFESRESHIPFVKDVCCHCNEPFEEKTLTKALERYLDWGNYCKKCSGKLSQIKTKIKPFGKSYKDYLRAAGYNVRTMKKLL